MRHLMRVMKRHDLINKKKKWQRQWQRQWQWQRHLNNTLKSDHGALWPLRHLIKVMRRPDLTKLDSEKHNLNIHSDPWLKSGRDSICNSCDVLIVSLKLEGQVCSSPVGTSTSPGGAFSDEAFHTQSPRSKVTAIKMRVGGEALDYIQVRDAKPIGIF